MAARSSAENIMLRLGSGLTTRQQRDPASVTAWSGGNKLRPRATMKPDSPMTTAKSQRAPLGVVGRTVTEAQIAAGNTRTNIDATQRASVRRRLAVIPI